MLLYQKWGFLWTGLGQTKSATFPRLMTYGWFSEITMYDGRVHKALLRPCHVKYYTGIWCASVWGGLFLKSLYHLHNCHYFHQLIMNTRSHFLKVVAAAAARVAFAIMIHCIFFACTFHDWTFIAEISSPELSSPCKFFPWHFHRKKICRIQLLPHVILSPGTLITL